MTDHDLTPEEREREATAKRESAEVLAAEKEMASLGLIEGIDLTHMAIKAVKGAREARRAALDSHQADDGSLDQAVTMANDLGGEVVKLSAEVERLQEALQKIIDAHDEEAGIAYGDDLEDYVLSIAHAALNKKGEGDG